MPALSNSRYVLSRFHDRRSGAARWLRVCGDLISRAADLAQPNFANEPDKEAPTDSAPESSADVTLLLEVLINGHSTGKIGEFTMHRGKLMARPAELTDLGFRLPESIAIGLHRPDRIV